MNEKKQLFDVLLTFVPEIGKQLLLKKKTSHFSKLTKTEIAPGNCRRQE